MKELMTAALGGRRRDKGRRGLQPNGRASYSLAIGLSFGRGQQRYGHGEIVLPSGQAGKREGGAANGR
ncbi:MAG: hypothetical protein NVSMB1_19970 [Polyangiales bacterium]